MTSRTALRMATLIRKWGSDGDWDDARQGRWDFAPTLDEERAYSNRPRYVYFMQSGDAGPIKIGSAFDPASRLIELQIGSPEKLALLGTAWGPRLEPFLHRLLARVCIRGEWYMNVSLTRDVMTDPTLDLAANTSEIWNECLAARGLRMVWRDAEGRECG